MCGQPQQAVQQTQQRRLLAHAQRGAQADVLQPEGRDVPRHGFPRKGGQRWLAAACLHCTAGARLHRIAHGAYNVAGYESAHTVQRECVQRRAVHGRHGGQRVQQSNRMQPLSKVARPRAAQVARGGCCGAIAQHKGVRRADSEEGGHIVHKWRGGRREGRWNRDAAGSSSGASRGGWHNVKKSAGSRDEGWGREQAGQSGGGRICLQSRNERDGVVAHDERRRYSDRKHAVRGAPHRARDA